MKRTTRLIFLLPAIFVPLPSAYSQQVQVQRSSSPQGVQILGNTELKAQQENAAAAASGEANAARNTGGAVPGGTQIQGNTRVKAEQKNVKATAAGKHNAAANEAGVIGGK